eukprot:m.77400 g.77400  ORF g.77400 m.77400 type:complete len:384 (-) comp20676_c0_seq1:116-1267(-)
MENFEINTMRFYETVNNDDGTILGLPFEIVQRILEMLPTAWDKGSAALVCRAWYRASLLPSIWHNAEIAVSNPQWKRKMGGYCGLDDDCFAYALRYMPERQFEFVKARNIHRLRLNGPNIWQDAAYFTTLNAECPTLTHLSLRQFCPPRLAVECLNQKFQLLKHVTLDRVHEIPALKNIESLALVESNIRDRALLVDLRPLTKLKKLTLVACNRLTPWSLAQLRTRFPDIKEVRVFRSWDESNKELALLKRTLRGTDKPFVKVRAQYNFVGQAPEVKGKKLSGGEWANLFDEEKGSAPKQLLSSSAAVTSTAATTSSRNRLHSAAAAATQLRANKKVPAPSVPVWRPAFRQTQGGLGGGGGGASSSVTGGVVVVPLRRQGKRR